MSFVIALLLMLCLTPVQALAVGNGTLTLNYDYDGVAFQIYHAADTDGNLTGAFSGYPVVIPDSGAGAWQDAAATLAAYVSGNNISPDAVGTITNGSVRFSGLDDGIYLVTGESSREGNYTYTPVPFLVRITGPVDSVTANVKYDRSGGSDLPEYSSYTVKKVWSGDTAATRPASVTVRLLHNGKEIGTVTLQESNGWSHTWNRLEDDGTYQVIEADVPEGYTVSVSQNGMTFTVTNTAKTPDTPDNPDDPANPDDPDNPDNPDEPDKPQPPQKPNLPQTGQLWWPVAVLLGVGVVLLLLRRRKKRRTTDE
jgi:LPXTG-motif cell wall-anchored protein